MLSFQIVCVECRSSNLKIRTQYLTKANGKRKFLCCLDCSRAFSETKMTPIEGLRSPLSLVTKVIGARLEGLGFNATARLFKISRNTLRSWEKRFSNLSKPLVLYALTHKFLEQVIEGDELYTKVDKNTPAQESKGWTIVLMDRASRFLWVQKCGKRNENLFKAAIKRLCKVIEATQDLTLVTDGERRYGNLLFEMCSGFFVTKNRGRKKKLSQEDSRSASRTKGPAKVRVELSEKNTRHHMLSIHRPVKTLPRKTSRQIA